MKLPRNARVFRGNFDFTPYASVFFLLVLFMMIASSVYIPGIRLNLPVAEDLSGVDGPTEKVAIDSTGRLYFHYQVIEEPDLKLRLAEIARNSSEPVTLVILADKAVAYDNLIRLGVMARDAGITNALLAALPRVATATAPPASNSGPAGTSP